MRTQRPMMIDVDDADPTDAINAFLHVLNKQRSLGLCPRTEHTIAEHLFRGDAKIVFYSIAGGIISLIESEDLLDPDDAMETLLFIAERRKAYRARKRLASGIEARSDATPESGAAEGESAVPEAGAPPHAQPLTPKDQKQ